MKSRRNAPRAPSGGSVSKLMRFLEIGRALGLMICAGIGGILAYQFKPIQSWINALIYPVEARVDVFTQRKEVFEDDQFVVDVFVTSTKWNAVPAGVIEIDYPHKIFEIMHDSRAQIATEKIEESRKVSPEGGIRFHAHTPGSGEIKARLRLPKSSKEFVGTESFVVLPVAKREYPTLSNFSGNWTLELGNRNAEVKLMQTNMNVTGTYQFLDSNRGGFISGIRDSTFNVKMSSPSNPLLRYHLEVPTPSSDANGIELKGKAKRQEGTASNSEPGVVIWKNVEEIDFHMVAARR